jgi:hypothetical protein
MSNNIKLQNFSEAVNLTLSSEPILVASPDAKYTHTQSISADTWVVDHNLNKYCSVIIANDDNEMIHGEVQYNSVNQLTVTFTPGTYLTGKVYCN